MRVVLLPPPPSYRFRSIECRKRIWRSHTTDSTEQDDQQSKDWLRMGAQNDWILSVAVSRHGLADNETEEDNT